ncbi:hypothetical protein Gotri_014365 [Gossypium trilobum]|uniref:Uncharacterized protein n=1 Tax=Gossypium trilobum TaxID=34281 RepID=A0A7J9DWN6_9ROSI|nr:hypothetical protein [Gossypium trilobum]
MKERLPDSIGRSKRFFMWKSIAKVWPLMKDNMIWSVGDDANIHCWKDAWVPNVGPLINHVSAHANVISNYKLNEMILKDGSWNLDLFRVWLPEEIIHLILSDFSAKSAYRLMKESSLLKIINGTLCGTFLVHRELDISFAGRINILRPIMHFDDRLGAPTGEEYPRRIQQNFSSKDRWFLRYSPRENNQVVNTLAKLALNNDEDLCISDKPPVENQAALEEDKGMQNLSIKEREGLELVFEFDIIVSYGIDYDLFLLGKFKDFNNLLLVNDKWGGFEYPVSLMNGFRDCIIDCKLVEIPLIVFQYTWEWGRGMDLFVRE